MLEKLPDCVQTEPYHWAINALIVISLLCAVALGSLLIRVAIEAWRNWDNWDNW